MTPSQKKQALWLVLDMFVLAVTVCLLFLFSEAVSLYVLEHGRH